MVQIIIDNTNVEVDEGRSILDAARQLGIDIPAMCYQEGDPANNSCMCCLVRVDGAAGVVPACATPVREGMQVESESEAIRELRRTGIELLLADHAGDCHAPCENTCPAHMDVPDMLRHVARGRLSCGDRNGETRHCAARDTRPRLPRGLRKRLPTGPTRQSCRHLQDQAVCRRPRSRIGVTLSPCPHPMDGQARGDRRRRLDGAHGRVSPEPTRTPLYADRTAQTARRTAKRRILVRRIT